MSFTLKFSPDLSVNTAIPVIDSSGIYSATPPLNLTGYGAPNPAIADVVTATLTITTKDTAIPYVIDVFPTLPNTSDAPFTITPAMIGYTTSIPTQILKIKYTITGILPSGNPFTYSAWQLVGILSEIQCCVNELNALAVTALQCDCNDACSCKCKCPDEVTTFMKGYTLLYGIRQQISNKQLNKANATLALLQNLCSCQ